MESAVEIVIVNATRSTPNVLVFGHKPDGTPDPTDAWQVLANVNATRDSLLIYPRDTEVAASYDGGRFNTRPRAVTEKRRSFEVVSRSDGGADLVALADPVQPAGAIAVANKAGRELDVMLIKGTRPFVRQSLSDQQNVVVELEDVLYVSATPPGGGDASPAARVDLSGIAQMTVELSGGEGDYKFTVTDVVRRD